MTAGRWAKRAFFLPFFCLFLATASCALPKIIVLHDPLSPEEHINLGLAYEKEGETKNAIEEYKKASKELPAGYLYLGNIYYGKGEYSDAEKYYRKAVRKDPGLADAYNNLAWLLYTCGRNIQEGEELARKAVALAPSNEAYRDTLGKLEDEMKQDVTAPAGR